MKVSLKSFHDFWDTLIFYKRYFLIVTLSSFHISSTYS